MRWFAVHQELATNRKWLELPMDMRGAWITVLTIASASQPRGRIRDRATAEALFAREIAAFREMGEPDYFVAELIDRGWIDEDDDGTLTMHDFDEWQLAIRKPSDLPEAIKARVDKHRAKAKAPPHPPKEEGEERKGEVTDGNAGNALPESASLSSCPECGGDLVEKSSKHGPFVGCDSYPACDYIQRAPKPPAWAQSPEDRAIIAEQTPLLRRVS